MAFKSVKPRKKRLKARALKIAFTILGRAIKVCYSMDSRVRDEIDSLPDGFSFKLKIRPIGPEFIVMKQGKNINVIKSGEAEFNIEFKSIESAFYLVGGIKSAAECLRERRFIVNGDIYYLNKIMRIINIVQCYFFSKLWMAVLLRNQAPQRERKQIKIIAAVLFHR